MGQRWGGCQCGAVWGQCGAEMGWLSGADVAGQCGAEMGWLSVSVGAVWG